MSFEHIMFCVSYLQVTKLIEEGSSTKISRFAIHPDKILDWLVENHILSVALEGIHMGKHAKIFC
jgi:hypothetical protein